MRPARLGRHPEDVLGWGPRDGALRLLGLELRVLLLEGVGDVLEEDEGEDDVLYSAASVLPRSASAICQSWAS
jgi:hypothetical protein